jgi:Fur family transcriptional regulator, ferric uptake regulator
MQLQIVCKKGMRVQACLPRTAAVSLQLDVNWPIVASMKKQRIEKPDYERQLRRAGVRITRPRRIILEILRDTEGHPDAMEIFRRAVEVDKSISLSTVYRTMKLLETLGAIQRHAFVASITTI